MHPRDARTVWLPTDPPRPCPEVMTVEEVATFLRIEGTDRARSVRYYRERGLLRAVQIGKSVRFLLADVQEFVRNKANEEPR